MVSPEAILATNTSSLSVTEMASDLEHPERVVGLHFFNPVAVLPLVEIIRTPETDDASLATAWETAKSLRKRPVLVKDAPAFVVNRVLTRMTTVLMDALEQGNTVEETDEAILRLGMPMAPSVLLQMVGPRVANHVLETLNESYPDRFPLSKTLANYADGKEEIAVQGDNRRSVEEIQQAALEAIADEIQPHAGRGRRRKRRGHRHRAPPRCRLALLPGRGVEIPGSRGPAARAHSSLSRTVAAASARS